MKNVLKITVFSAFLVFGVTLAVPHQAHALILDRLFDGAPNGPHCLFMDCHDQQSQPTNVYVNSNNTNSFNNTTTVGTNYGAVNAPYSVSGSTGGSSGYSNGYNNLPPAHVSTGAYVTGTYATPSQAPAPAPVSNTNTNNNYNYNYNTGGGSAPVYYPTQTYATPTYYSQPYSSSYYYTTPYQPSYQPTYYQQPVYQQPVVYTQPITYAPSLQIACAADKTSSAIGSPVTWSAEATYLNQGSGFAYSWSGTEGLYGNSANAIMVYYSAGTKSAVVTVTAPNGVMSSKVCSNTVTVKSATAAKPAPKKIAQAPKVTPTPTPVVVTPTPEVSPAALFSLGNVPWGWVGILVILVLLGIIFYLIFNKKKI